MWSEGAGCRNRVGVTCISGEKGPAASVVRCDPGYVTGILPRPVSTFLKLGVLAGNTGKPASRIFHL